MRRVVFDTNLFVSSVLVKNGLPAQALQAWRERKFSLLISPPMIQEIRHTLGYDRIRRKYQVTDQDVDDLVALLEKNGLVVKGEADTAGAIPDDPDDEQILACAVDGRADFIVSGDRHLLDLKQYADMPVLTVREFIELIAEI
jgi:putative PIN family toxin of toxin-antitoxin system